MQITQGVSYQNRARQPGKLELRRKRGVKKQKFNVNLQTIPERDTMRRNHVTGRAKNSGRTDGNEGLAGCQKIGDGDSRGNHTGVKTKRVTTARGFKKVRRVGRAEPLERGDREIVSLDVEVNGNNEKRDQKSLSKRQKRICNQKGMK